MKRRAFLAGLASAVTIKTVRAQQTQGPQRVQKIGILMSLPPGANAQSDVLAFEHALNDLGWRAGTNPLIEIRWAGDYDHMRTDAVELVHLKPDVIFFMGAAFPSAAAATQTIPIVFVLASDAMVQEYVKDLRGRAGNATGFTSCELSLSGKRLELLKEIDPQITRALFVHSGQNASTQAQLRRLIQLSPSFSVNVTDGPAENDDDLERIAASCAAEANCGLVVAFDASTTAHREKIIELAAHNRLAATYPFDAFAKSGGLLSYGIDRSDQFRRAASYVDRLLRGARVAELPVQAADKFRLVLNLKTAKSLGLTVPPSLLAQADEVIE
jgi:putative tryptophan/tyrosine transport system substrate-binding protein